MNKVTVQVLYTLENKMVDVEGVPVRIGVIEDLFVATPRMQWGAHRFSDTHWDITHIPSGCSAQVSEPSPELAARATELKILNVGMEKYIHGIYKAMALRAETASEAK